MQTRVKTQRVYFHLDLRVPSCQRTNCVSQQPNVELANEFQAGILQMKKKVPKLLVEIAP